MSRTSRRFFRGSIALVLAATGWLAPAAARAAMCSQTSDCPKGFACQVVGVGGCATPACAPDQPCPATTTVCDAPMITECAPLPCKADSDCATGMVCYAQVSQSCPSSPPQPSCAAGTKCPVVDPGPCTTTTTNTCVPRYDLPCHVDSDCGNGFTCVPEVVTSCSGGSGTSSADGGGVTEPPQSSCTTMTLSTSQCSAKVVNCGADGDCPSDWTCVAEPQAISNIACGAPVIAEDGGTPPTPVCDPGPTPPPQKQCMPPYYDLSGGVGRSGSGTRGAGDASAPLSEGAGNPPQTARTTTTSGCQLGAGAGAGGGAAWLALFGLVGLARRRR